MKFSVTMGAAGAGRDPAGLAALALMAEECGWDGVFLEDYLVYQGQTALPTYDPWVCLAAMACGTERIRLGTTVTPVPRRLPWELAAQTVALDHLSGGRLILGVGAGDRADPFLHKGNRGDRLDEALVLIDRLWTGEEVDHDGEHFRVEAARLAATPVQQPRIPVWVGGDLTSPRVRSRILRWDGSCAYKGPPGGSEQITPDDVRALKAEARPGFQIKVSGGDPAAFAEAGATWWGRWIAPGADAAEVIRAGPPTV